MRVGRHAARLVESWPQRRFLFPAFLDPGEMYSGGFKPLPIFRV